MPDSAITISASFELIDTPSFTSATASVTNDPTPTWYWKTGNDSDNSGYYRYKLDSAATWTETTETSYIPSSSLSDGSYTLTVEEMNNAGDWSSAVSHTIHVNTAAPDAPTITTGSQATSGTTITITGTAEPYSTVTISGGSSTATGTADDIGNFSITVPLTPNAVNALSVTAADALGNTSSASTITITSDSIAPDVPTITTDSQTTSSTSITITGTAEAGSTVTILGGSCAATGTADSSGNLSITVPLTPNAVNALSVTAADALGNTSDASTIIITADNTAPSVPTITTGSQATSGTSITIMGTAEAGSTVTISGGSSTATGTADASGNYSITVPLNLNAENALCATATDAAGNTSDASSEITITSVSSAVPGNEGVSYRVTVTGEDSISTPLNVATSSSGATVTMGTAQNDILKDGGTLAISMPAIPGATSYGVKLPVSGLSLDTGGTLTLNTDLGDISLPSDMLSTIATDETAQISVSEGDSSALSSEVQAEIGDRPILRLTLSLGGTQIEWSNPAAPVTVSIPYTPSASELKNPDSIIVWYIDGNGNAVCVPNGHYDASTGTVVFTTTHFSQYAVGCNNVSFSDVSGWYEDYVNYLAARNIVGGTGDGQFSPAANITRAEFVTILARISGDDLSSYTTSSFSDVSISGWYFAAVQWAYKNGITFGSNGKFDPNADITREQMAVMLYRYAEYVGVDVSNVEGMSIREFLDYEDISNWSMIPIQWAINNSIISGYSDGGFAPAANATRAQAAKVVTLLAQEMIK